ncbi:hypothetical protein [Aliidiomarina sp. B3213]|uniref:hypothetical protein n=1 Tax=Aliidiomarina sp. B3213 TaxID=2249757 RepID=UPI000DD08E2A|nr:hypothetical protein [Aliidiomarina sp. B3213]RTE86696.1 hypothetical protein DQX04_09100 [Aliidiomarina sp. B3213]TCZ90750.1 hypothetical protein EYQ95_07945 [Lysobacter sp. N42]
MEYWLDKLAWIEPWLPWIVSISVLIILLSLVLVPMLVIKMPTDYFVEKSRPRHWTLSRRLLYLIRNLFALILLCAGILMLVLPGQGLLTILLAVVISDVPGKFYVERWLVSHKSVMRALNWIRRRYNRPELISPL